MWLSLYLISSNMVQQHKHNTLRREEFDIRIGQRRLNFSSSMACRLHMEKRIVAVCWRQTCSPLQKPRRIRPCHPRSMTGLRNLEQDRHRKPKDRECDGQEIQDATEKIRSKEKRMKCRDWFRCAQDSWTTSACCVAGTCWMVWYRSQRWKKTSALYPQLLWREKTNYECGLCKQISNNIYWQKTRGKKIGIIICYREECNANRNCMECQWRLLKLVSI